MVSGTRVIRKYPNRRLYDCGSSRYVTLTEVKQLVMQGESFVVQDARNGEDLTRAILLQIILEEEAAGMPLLSEAALANLIRFYGHAMQPFMGRTLEQQLQAIADWQQQLGQVTQSLQGPALQALMNNYLQQSHQAMSELQNQLQRQSGQMLSAFGLKL
jgi:polyhydroxyalkanoate synthesis repressor PhaR